MTAAALIALVATSGAVPDGSFLPACTSSDDHGWPRFQSSAELKANTQWHEYFMRVYGMIPDKYPVCTYDLWYIDLPAWEATGLNLTRLAHSLNNDCIKMFTPHDVLWRKVVINPENPYAPPSKLNNGDLFVSTTIGYVALGIYHDKWTPLPNNTWWRFLWIYTHTLTTLEDDDRPLTTHSSPLRIEVTHAVIPTELAGAWAWRQPGSGVWYNTGRTIVFPTPQNMSEVHKVAIEYLKEGCSLQISSYWPLLVQKQTRRHCFTPVCCCFWVYLIVVLTCISHRKAKFSAFVRVKKALTLSSSSRCKGKYRWELSGFRDWQRWFWWGLMAISPAESRTPLRRPCGALAIDWSRPYDTIQSTRTHTSSAILWHTKSNHYSDSMFACSQKCCYLTSDPDGEQPSDVDVWTSQSQTAAAWCPWPSTPRTSRARCRACAKTASSTSAKRVPRTPARDTAALFCEREHSLGDDDLLISKCDRYGSLIAERLTKYSNKCTSIRIDLSLSLVCHLSGVPHAWHTDDFIQYSVTYSICIYSVY